jgi:ABC-type Fe3+/spermidine/putrescine transport system ATPase subunit
VILELAGVTRRFGEVTAVDGLSFSLDAGEFVTLLGPSGCGKTTALRLIAGFETPDAGQVLFRGRDVSAESPQRRGFGMVFQNYALFPHLNVFENVAFGLKARGQARDTIASQVTAALARVDLAGYEKRAVQALSGGQQQRVALARALAIEPPLLLLDEPLSNLDQALRVQTRTELRRLVKELGITALFVTHDQEEAFDLSDRIAVMQAGRLRQIGTPRELYQEPADRFTAAFMGRASFVPVGLLEGWEGGGGTVLLRPEDLEFTGESDALLSGVVRERRFRGALTFYRVAVAGGGETGELEVEVAHGGAGAGVGAGAGGRVDAGAGAGAGPALGERVHLRLRAGFRPRYFGADERAGKGGRAQAEPGR